MLFRSLRWFGIAAALTVMAAALALTLNNYAPAEGTATRWYPGTVANTTHMAMLRAELVAARTQNMELAAVLAENAEVPELANTTQISALLRAELAAACTELAAVRAQNAVLSAELEDLKTRTGSSHVMSGSPTFISSTQTASQTSTQLGMPSSTHTTSQTSTLSSTSQGCPLMEHSTLTGHPALVSFSELRRCLLGNWPSPPTMNSSVVVYENASACICRLASQRAGGAIRHMDVCQPDDDDAAKFESASLFRAYTQFARTRLRGELAAEGGLPLLRFMYHTGGSGGLGDHIRGLTEGLFLSMASRSPRAILLMTPAHGTPH